MPRVGRGVPKAVRRRPTTVTVDPYLAMSPMTWARKAPAMNDGLWALTMSDLAVPACRWCGFEAGEVFLDDNLECGSCSVLRRADRRALQRRVREVGLIRLRTARVVAQYLDDRGFNLSCDPAPVFEYEEDERDDWGCVLGE